MTSGYDRAREAQTERQKRLFDVALATRNLEIDLLWKRSLFFWGFIAAAFVAYASVAKDTQAEPVDKILVGAFGAVCSLCWTLANRGSKYWQQAWEDRLFRAEHEVLGDRPFGTAFKPKRSRLHLWGQWSIEWHFSVSRLAIALSDFTFLVWLVLTARVVPGPQWPEWATKSLPVLLPLLTVAYATTILFHARSYNRDR